MASLDSELDRLLHSAADKPRDEAAQVPFGFDTRVVALWRSQRSREADESPEFARMFRRVAFAAMLVALFASAAAYWQLQQNNDLAGPLTNDYAIADNAIETGALP